MAQLMQVIVCQTLRGLGRDAGDPVRSVVQYWSTDGELLAEVDHFRPDDRPDADLKKHLEAVLDALDSAGCGCSATPRWPCEGCKARLSALGQNARKALRSCAGGR